MIHHKKFRAKNTGSPLIRILFMLSIGAIIAALLFVFSSPSALESRVTIVVSGDPVQVWSFDPVDRNVINVILPAATVIDGAYGYGLYSLSALWKLGIIDGKSGVVLADSVANALGIPVALHIGNANDTPLSVDPGLPGIKRVFSWSGIHKFLNKSYTTNISLRKVAALTLLSQTFKQDSIRSFDFTKRSVTYDSELPDNTVQKIMDTQMVDAIIDHVFENTEIRKEALSIALYNTTDVPALATRAARFLTSAGMLVITVENAKGSLNGCEISGAKEMEKTKTVSIIRSMLQCEFVPSEGYSSADITVKIGIDFATRYIAKKDAHN